MHAIAKYFEKLNEPADIRLIESLEQRIGTRLPDQYRQFLLLSDGGDFYNSLLTPPHHHQAEVISNLDEVRMVISSCNIWQQRNNSGEESLYLQNQEDVLEISATMSGYGVHIGIRGDFTGKIYVSETEEIYTADDGKATIPIFFVANSLAEFLAILKPFGD